MREVRFIIAFSLVAAAAALYGVYALYEAVTTEKADFIVGPQKVAELVQGSECATNAALSHLDKGTPITVSSMADIQRACHLNEPSSEAARIVTLQRSAIQRIGVKE